MTVENDIIAISELTKIKQILLIQLTKMTFICLYSVYLYQSTF